MENNINLKKKFTIAVISVFKISVAIKKNRVDFLKLLKIKNQLKNKSGFYAFNNLLFKYL